MTWKYRCMKCRGRNVFKQKLDGWSVEACRHCGHDKFYVDRRRQWRTDYCRCEGYHHTHRIGSTYCEHNPRFEVNVRVDRYGERLEDVLIDIFLRDWLEIFPELEREHE